MLKRTYDIVIDVVNGVTEKFIELIQASTGIRELAIKLTDGEDVFDVENKKIVVLKETDIMSRFLQAKTLILGGRYERSKMEYQLKRYLEAGQLTQEEYDELISLMDARELVE